MSFQVLLHFHSEDNCVANFWNDGYPDGYGDCIFVQLNSVEPNKMLRDYPCSTSFYFACDAYAPDSINYETGTLYVSNS